MVNPVVKKKKGHMATLGAKKGKATLTDLTTSSSNVTKGPGKHGH